jgi:hypothetical protein
MRISRLSVPLRTMLAAACMATSLAAAPAAATGDGDRAEAWRATCTHYVNRARYKSREERVEFVTVVADGCAAALSTAEGAATATAAERVAAERFLDRLTAARAAISEINARRLAVAAVRRAQDDSFTRFARDLARDLRLVGATGEYLILRAEGVYAALDDWVEAGAEFALIAALPRRDG